MTRRHAPIAILGAGAVGSATAYHLAKRGEPFVLLDQFAPGHDRGSSHGTARIIRHSYADPTYARLMLAAFAAWRVLEADVARPLYIRTGGVSICPRPVAYVAQVAASLDAIAIPHRRMTGADLNRAIPAFGVDPDSDVVFEPDAGLIAAAQALASFLDFARQVGGDSAEIRWETPVRRIDLEADRPTLILDHEILTVDRLIVAAGPWTGRLLPHLPFSLRPTRQRVLYLQPPPGGQFALGRFPAFIFMGSSPDQAYYGMPPALGMGVKVARHGGPDADPDAALPSPPDQPDVTAIRAFLATTVPELAEAPIEWSESCFYTMTDDDHFRVGALPDRPDVIVASPCSGHGFKFACLMGGILADIAIDGMNPFTVESWRVNAG